MNIWTDTMSVPVWLVALLAVVVIVARALAEWGGVREARAREAEAAVVALHAGDITELHAELNTLCAQARDHIAVLDAFRAGWDLTDDEINSAESLALLAAAANITPEAVQAEMRARHAMESPTTALPKVPPAGSQTSGQA